MRIRFFLFFFLFAVNSNAQSWQSISKIGTFETAPFRQFSIDPYRNNIWLIHDTKVSVIENSGAIHVFTSAELGPLWTHDKIKFAFTPTNIYYNIDVFGFHSFTNYNSVLIDSSFYDYSSITSNYDTVYISLGYPNGFRKFYNGITENFYKNFTEIDAKNQFLYGNNGSSAIFRYIQATNTSINLTSDSDYLFGIFHDTKFSRKSDTLFVAGKKGISYAYNYDFLDTITPNNTINMPSPNVLEIEFDDKDSLWAVFGDVNDTPFALAKLEGNTWANRFDNSNSPIDFSNFYGLEIDTLGNIWVADLNYLHTLLNPNSPAWLGLHDNGKANQIKLFPNPATKSFTISGISSSFLGEKAKLKDLCGKIVMEFELNEPNQKVEVSQLRKGIYLLQIGESTKKIIIE